VADLVLVRRIKRSFAFSVLLAVLIVSLDRATASETRDLALYDKIGPFELRLLDAAPSKKSQVSEFVWQHWTERRRGCAVITLYSVEGEPSTFHMFIEPDGSGQWHIDIRGEHDRAGRPGRDAGKRWHETSRFDIRAVERVRHPAGGHYLSMKDSAGKEVFIW
jgi:hypothetical protein